ncbi:hypothetical protein PoB_004107300 [Plakobranchus ocellatus]|uniref:Uncharacterized protein n=1 Tax=Plakobranchus ocellatus TaxID=259542 RepID=A0AAV4B639_9GAST|nr:hypothetical protein PoB_004107300 [Plakobranchus ocellatus]
MYVTDLGPRRNTAGQKGESSLETINLIQAHLVYRPPGRAHARLPEVSISQASPATGSRSVFWSLTPTRRKLWQYQDDNSTDSVEHQWNDPDHTRKKIRRRNRKRIILKPHETETAW